MNHHVYLGMIAENSRWHLDVNADNSQSYQYPYLYWPAYRLSLLTGPGAWFGAAWAAFQAVMVIVPLWWISLRLLPNTDNLIESVVLRWVACAFAGLSGVVLIALDTTASDLLASVPLLWACAVGLGAPATDRRAFATAALWGVSVAFKLSNGLFLPLLLFWWLEPTQHYLPWRRGLALASGATVGFVALYAPWGWPLWQLTGNPFYPFMGQFFAGA